MGFRKAHWTSTPPHGTHGGTFRTDPPDGGITRPENPTAPRPCITPPSACTALTLLFIPAVAPADGPRPTAAVVLEGLREFYRQDRARPTARSGPASTPTTRACPTAPTATWRRSRTPSPSTRRSAGSCPHEEKTVEFLLGRQQRDGRVLQRRRHGRSEVAGRARPTTRRRAWSPCSAWAPSRKHDPLPVFDDDPEGRTTRRCRRTSTSFFPLAYLCSGKPIPARGRPQDPGADGPGRGRLPERPRRRHVPRRRTTTG